MLHNNLSMLLLFQSSGLGVAHEIELWFPKNLINHGSFGI